MKRPGRIAALLLAFSALVILTALPALGQEDVENTDAEVVETGPPAVEIPDEAAAETIPDWTYRYMIPTTLVLAAVVILLTSIRYFTNVVRRRYRTVQE
jgi:hypothetical protein